MWIWLQVLHSLHRREKDRKRERDHSNHCALSPVPHPSTFTSFKRLLSQKLAQNLAQKLAQSRHCALHITTALCIMHTLHSRKNAHADCCILWENYNMVAYRELLVSWPHPPPYREQLHRTGESHYQRDGAFHTPSTGECVSHWCGLFEALLLVFPLSADSFL